MIGQLLRLTLLIPLLSLLSCAAGNIDKASSGRISELWTVDVDHRRPADPSGFSQPAFAEGSNRVVIGGRDARIRIFDVNGREVAAIPIEEPSDSGSLALAGGLVITGDVGGNLYAVDPVAARIVWSYKLGAPFMSAPVALNDGFLVQTIDDHLYHFSAGGEKRWSYTGMGSGLSLYMTSPPMVHNQIVYALFANGDAVALKAAGGDLIWRKQLLLSNDAAVLTELRAPVAQPLYLNQVSIGMERASEAVLVAFYQGSILVLAGRDGRQLFAVDTSIKSVPLAVDGVLYIANAAGELEAIDLNSGTTLWKKKLTDGELIGPVVYNGLLWLADDQGSLLRLKMDGTGLASVTLSGRVERAPIVTPAGVLVRTGPGQLSLLR